MCKCVFCKKLIDGEPEYSIHRDGFGEGPDVPLCNGCGGSPSPTCAEIWERLAKEREVKAAAYWKET